MIFHNPWVLAALLVLIPLAYLYYKRMTRAGVRFSSTAVIKTMPGTFRMKAGRFLFMFRVLSLALFIIALARPQSPIQETEITVEGIDIVLALDVSTSMLAEDFELNGVRMNRLDVVKTVVKDFIRKRHSDRIGIVVFGSRAYTAAPLTLDYPWLLENLERVHIAMVEDGTAIGSGIMASLNRIKDTKAKSKIIILLTDGRNNAGRISPLMAAQAARALKVKIYTIGAGTKGLAPYPVKDGFGNTVYRPVKIDIDEDTLKKIAERTGGRYFRATDSKSLKEIYDEINKLEKTEIKEKGYMEYKELFYFFLIPGLIILLLEIFLSNTVFRTVP
jgi:Ca-activated chloride channel family protein